MGSCGSYHDITICSRYRDNGSLCVKTQDAPILPSRHDSRKVPFQGASVTVRTDFTAAVNHESRNPLCTGNRQWFRFWSNGGIRSRCENRQSCIHATSGIWKCILHFREPEQRCRKKRQDKGRYESRFHAGDGIRPDYIPHYIHIPIILYVHIY